MEEIRPQASINYYTKIEAVGAIVICLSPTLAYFNSMEQWWSQLNSFLL
jgi:hypothetical protein